MLRPIMPSRFTRFGLGTGFVVACLLSGCSTGDTSEPGLLESVFGTSQTTTSSTRPSQDNEPMTLFEKRRLVARLQQDPRTLQRLTPRERREVAAMVNAANRNDDDKKNN